MNDLKFAFRQLLKNPGFTALAVLTVAAGLKTHLFEVGPADPLTAMVIVVMAITLATCWIPARRAARVEPLATLRNE